MIYIQLFLSFLQIGLFSFGGGYAAMPLIQSQVVDLYHWLTLGEFTDLITISQMTPGPIAVNSATFVGLRLGGVLGAVIATLGCILPSCIIVFLLARIYLKYKEVPMIQGVLGSLRPAVVAMIASAGLSILILSFWGEGVFSIQFSDLRLQAVAIFIIAMVLLRKFKWNPIGVMALCGVLEVGCYYLQEISL